MTSRESGGLLWWYVVSRLENWACRCMVSVSPLHPTGDHEGPPNHSSPHSPLRGGCHWKHRNGGGRKRSLPTEKQRRHHHDTRIGTAGDASVPFPLLASPAHTRLCIQSPQFGATMVLE